MQPLAVITGILLGTCAAIAAGLTVVLFLFFILVDDHPRLAVEFEPLRSSTAIFLVMTAICAASFVGLIRRRPWRWAAQSAMWTGIVLTVMYYLR
jgi:hypothetical protein